MTGKSLFRSEVLSRYRGDTMGVILVAAPLSRWWLSALASALGGVLLLFLCLGHYTRREAVTGQLVPSAGLLTLAAPGAGIVSQLHVHDGQTVRRGDVLLELCTEQDSTALGETHAFVSEALESQRLHADLTNQARMACRNPVHRWCSTLIAARRTNRRQVCRCSSASPAELQATAPALRGRLR